MSNEIYNGSSEGFDYLIDGYMEYSKEVIGRRAIPDIRDGLKPVQRRILYSAKKNDKKTYQKCATFVADAMKLHPHGDSSVYGAFVLMTDSNGSWNMPVFDGMGNLGKVYSSNPPAAYRYPKARLHPNAKEYFKEENIFNLVQSEEGDGVEPDVLYPSYPTVLVNGTAGIAVSVGTRIPSFNFCDVLDLTMKYIKNGSLDPVKDIIYPDFPTGGVLVKTDSEVAKIMATGKGKLKIRANVEIQGNEIVVTEVPYGKTFESIVKAIDSAEIKEIKSAINLTGNDSNGKVVVVCKSRRIVNWVLMELYRRGILQSVFASSILVVNNDKPYILGVHGIIAEWVKFRRSVILKKFETELNNINSELVILDYFIRLINNKDWRDTYVAKATKVSKKVADDYLHEIFPDIPDDVCNWINGRAISAFNNGGKYLKRFSELTDYSEYCQDMKNNPDKYILNEMSELKREHINSCPRKTFISNTDYKFSKIADTEGIEDDSPCVYTLTKDGYMLKTREFVKDVDVLCQFRGQANSILVGFDNYGRVLRLYGSELAFTPIGGEGIYLPKVFDASFQEDYHILYMCICDGSKKMLVYTDGYVSFLDTSEWVGKKVVKAISKGVNTAVMDKLLDIVELGEEDTPQCLLCIDNSGKRMKVGLIDTANVPERGRLGRAKVFSNSNIDMHYLKGMSYLDVHSNIKNPDDYMGKMVKVTEETFTGDVGDVEDGKYLEFCCNLE